MMGSTLAGDVKSEKCKIKSFETSHVTCDVIGWVLDQRGWVQFLLDSHREWTIEYSRVALPCTFPPVWLELPDLLFNPNPRGQGP